MILTFIEPYNRPSDWKVVGHSMTKALHRLFFEPTWLCLATWIIVLLVVLAVRGMYKNSDGGKVAERTFLKYEGVFFVGFISIIGLGLFNSHVATTKYNQKPNMQALAGRYKKDGSSRIMSSTLGLDSLVVKKHDVYGYRNRKLAFDFRFNHSEYYHPLTITTRMGQGGMYANASEDHYIARTTGDNNGVLLSGYYRANPYRLYQRAVPQTKVLKSTDTYGVVPSTYFRLFDFTNAGTHIPLPKPGTTMIIGKRNGRLGINPNGARTVADTYYLQPGADVFSRARLNGASPNDTTPKSNGFIKG